MKKLFYFSALTMTIMSLSSFTKVEKPPLVQEWVVTCGDGSYGGRFVCACNQSQANAIAAIMCK